MEEFILTEENYYSFESNKLFMSASQFGEWKSCEASAVAQFVTGEYVPEPKECFIEGNYVHRSLLQPKKLEEYIKEYESEIVSGQGKTKGEVKSPYKICDRSIEAFKAQPAFNKLLELCPEREKILTFEMFGIDWKCALDASSFNMLCDIKTTSGILKEHWKESTTVEEKGAYVSFIELFNYYRQMAIYAEGMKLNDLADDHIKVHILAVEKVAKGKTPNVEWFYLDAKQRFIEELEEVRLNIPRILELKSGEEKPKNCNRCDYCLQNKIIKAPITLQGFGGK